MLKVRKIESEIKVTHYVECSIDINGINREIVLVCNSMSSDNKEEMSDIEEIRLLNFEEYPIYIFLSG